MDNEQECWMSHGDYISMVPEGFISIGQTAHTPFAPLPMRRKPLWSPISSRGKTYCQWYENIRKLFIRNM